MHRLRIHRRFFASHAIRLYDGSVEPLHAHDWKVLVEIAGDSLDKIEVVMDFHELEKIVEAAIGPLREKNLGEFINSRRSPGVEATGQGGREPANPTAERIAQYLYHRIGPQLPAGVRLAGVTITEAPGCQAEYGP